ncbi:MAG: DNA repair protein RadC [Bacteroidales bacterium]|nr:DNA repair protein RadC [Bacteroidales bacterium]
MDKLNNSIKNWAEEDRPREKLLKKGVRALSNAELIAILLRTGTANANAIEVARNLLKTANEDLNILAQFDINKLKSINGLGFAKAVTIKAALELGNRRQLQTSLQLPSFSSSKEVYTFFKSIIGDSTQEESWYITLNNANKLKGYYSLSKGGKTGTVIDIKLILKQAIIDEASAIILAHNHPSGNLKPSDQDIQITDKLNKASEIMQIKLLDHLIITQIDYFSFADNGMI